MVPKYPPQREMVNISNISICHQNKILAHGPNPLHPHIKISKKIPLLQRVKKVLLFTGKLWYDNMTATFAARELCTHKEETFVLERNKSKINGMWYINMKKLPENNPPLNNIANRVYEIRKKRKSLTNSIKKRGTQPLWTVSKPSNQVFWNMDRTNRRVSNQTP